MAPRLMNKHFEESDDVDIQKYSKLKWKLLTTWFNLLTTPYLPLCLYCDWCTLERKHHRRHVKIFNEIRTFLFTNLIFPVTTFADILFWRLWVLNRELLVPLAADKYVSVWEHHSMHTASLVFVVTELLMVYRKRPKNKLHGVIALLSFITVYTSVCVYSLLNEEYVYPLFRIYKGHKLVVLGLYAYLSNLFYHSGQWIVLDIIYGQKFINKKLL